MRIIDNFSDFFRKLIPAWLQPNTSSSGLCSTFSVKDLSVDGYQMVIHPRIAVHIHLFYFDLLDELILHLDNISYSFDLFITAVSKISEIEDKIRCKFKNAKVILVENRGRDIGGFLLVLNKFDLDGYDIVLKIHSKKSLNIDSYIEAVKGLFGQDIVNGDVWRKQLLEPILGNRERVGRIIAAFQMNHDLGMVGASKFLCSVPDSNALLFKDLCRRLQVKEEICFFAGTMFWIRGRLLSRIKASGFDSTDFKVDSMAVEGELEHCFERVFGTLVASQDSFVAGA